MTIKNKIGPTFDVKKEYRYLFSPPAKEPEIIEVPAFKYIMLDGQGYPGTELSFQEKVQALYALAYTIKFSLKQAPKDSLNFTVPPLSGLYCADDCRSFRDESRKNEWKWTVMILMPDRITNETFEQTRNEVIKKKKLPHLQDVVFQVYKEGLCAQVMHIGPYSEEAPTIDKLHAFFQEKGYTFNGRHHEIYLSDPRRCEPQKMKTIIRQPIVRK